MERYWIANTVTGEKVEDITHLVVDKGSWSRETNSYGDGDITLNMNASSFDWVTHQAWLEPWTNKIVRTFDDIDTTGSLVSQVLHDGLITDWAWNPFTGQVHVSSSEHEILYSRRYPMTIGRFPEGTISLDNTTGRVAMFFSIQQTFMSFPTPRSRLPIIDTWFVLDEPGPNDYNWPNYQFKSLADIHDIVREQGGPDHDIRTHHIDGKFLIEPRVGGGPGGELLVPSVPMQFVVSAANTDALGLERTRDGMDQLTGIFVTGDGIDENIKRQEEGELVGGGYTYTGPYLDAVFTRNGDDDDASLKRTATAMRNEFAGTVDGFDMSMDMGRNATKLKQLTPGYRVEILYPQDKMFPAETLTRRVRSYKGSNGRVEFTLAMPRG